MSSPVNVLPGCGNKEHPDHLSERGIEHLWAQFKRQGSYEEWQLIVDVTFHDLRHDFAHRARQSGWSLEEIAVYAGHQTKDGAPAIATTGSLYLALPQTTQRAGSALARLNGKGKECMAKFVVLLSPTQRTKLLQIPDNFSEREHHPVLLAFSRGPCGDRAASTSTESSGLYCSARLSQISGRPWDAQEQVSPAILTYLAEQIGEAPRCVCRLCHTRSDAA